MARRTPSTSPNTLEGERKAEGRGWKTPTVIAAIIVAVAAISVALTNQLAAPKLKSSAPTTIDNRPMVQIALPSRMCRGM